MFCPETENTEEPFTSLLVTAVGAGDMVVKNGRGLVAGVKALGAITVIPKDGAVAIWDSLTSSTELRQNGSPIRCDTSIVLNFSAAGSAWILYR